MYIISAKFFLFCLFVWVFFCGEGSRKTAHSCCVLFYCVHPILLKGTNWRCGVHDPWACKGDSPYFAGLIRAEVPIVLQWIYQSSADVPENKALRIGCASSNTFPSFSQNFFLILSFCRGEVILYFLMKSRWVTFKKKKKGRKEKAEDSQRKYWMSKMLWKI